MNESDVEENIAEFLDEHGVEGLYAAYFKEFIYHFILQELKSSGEAGPSISPVHAADSETVRQIKRDIRERSEYWAWQLVEELGSTKDPQIDFKSEEIEDLPDADEFQSIVHSTFDDWNSQKDELVQEIQHEYDL